MLELSARTRLGELDLDVALTVPDGSCLAIAGPSGAGKSTILRIAAGLLRPDHGRVRFGEETWLDTDRDLSLSPERRRCGYLFQDGALFPHLRAWQNVAYGMRGEVRGRGERRRRAEGLLERFAVGHLADAHPRTLSGGESRRVALARALARRPRALLLDEPLSALDSRTRAAATRELGAVLREAEVPALLVTHDFAEAATLGDVVGVIAAGRLVQEGTGAELAARPASAFVADFSGASVLVGEARDGEGGLARVALEGGGTIASADRMTGPVAASVFPWEVELEPPGESAVGSARNRIPAEVESLTAIGSRVRVALRTPQPLVAEITEASARALALRSGSRVIAAWKATATRLSDR